jgi:hypothetical protein
MAGEAGILKTKKPHKIRSYLGKKQMSLRISLLPAPTQKEGRDTVQLQLRVNTPAPTQKGGRDTVQLQLRVNTNTLSLSSPAILQQII